MDSGRRTGGDATQPGKRVSALADGRENGSALNWLKERESGVKLLCFL